MIAFLLVPVILFGTYCMVYVDEGEKIFQVRGTLSQGRYLFLLFASNSFLIPAYALSSLGGTMITAIVLICSFFSIFLTISSGIRRLRDIGWNSFLILIPFVYLVIIFLPTKKNIFNDTKESDESVASDELKELENKVKIARLKKELKDLEENNK